jgi:8-oxo-dGTP pyrophosphatase MutT (NUDIX family)
MIDRMKKSSDLLKFDFKGNGVILIWENRFVFAIGKESYWDKSSEPWKITFTNVGGKVEAGETMLVATKREVLEELGCNVRIFPSERTLCCDLENPIFTEYELEDEVPPILIYNSEAMKMSVCVYKARINDEPEPHQEVPALLFLNPSSIKGGELTELVLKGCTIKSQSFIDIPENVSFIPFGSAELMAKYYDKFNKVANFDRLFF